MDDRSNSVRFERTRSSSISVPMWVRTTYVKGVAKPGE